MNENQDIRESAEKNELQGQPLSDENANAVTGGAARPSKRTLWCGKCQKSFTNAADYDLHMELVHRNS